MTLKVVCRQNEFILNVSSGPNNINIGTYFDMQKNQTHYLFVNYYIIEESDRRT